MNFDELHAMIPYAKGGKEKVLTMSPYPGIELALPGRHAEDTTPKGGDFVVRVTDKTLGWKKHEFTHTDIFNYVDDEPGPYFMKEYFDLVTGKDPGPTVISRAMQCLAVAEHRRYAKYENLYGGRFLPFRFAAGIAEGLWDSASASAMQRKGRPGVEILEKMNGLPVLTRKLMEND